MDPFIFAWYTFGLLWLQGAHKNLIRLCEFLINDQRAKLACQLTLTNIVFHIPNIVCTLQNSMFSSKEKVTVGIGVYSRMVPKNSSALITSLSLLL